MFGVMQQFSLKNIMNKSLKDQINILRHMLCQEEFLPADSSLCFHYGIFLSDIEKFEEQIIACENLIQERFTVR